MDQQDTAIDALEERSREFVTRFLPQRDAQFAPYDQSWQFAPDFFYSSWETASFVPTARELERCLDSFEVLLTTAARDTLLTPCPVYGVISAAQLTNFYVRRTIASNGTVPPRHALQALLKQAIHGWFRVGEVYLAGDGRAVLMQLSDMLQAPDDLA